MIWLFPVIKGTSSVAANYHEKESLGHNGLASKLYRFSRFGNS